MIPNAECCQMFQVFGYQCRCFEMCSQFKLHDPFELFTCMQAVHGSMTSLIGSSGEGIGWKIYWNEWKIDKHLFLEVWKLVQICNIETYESSIGLMEAVRHCWVSCNSMGFLQGLSNIVKSRE